MKKLLTGCLVVILLLAGIVMMPQNVQATEANSQLIDESGNYLIGDYWTETTRKAPTKEGYVFGGWYKKDGENFVAIKESELNDEVVKNMTAQDAYPKFVPDEVLSIKTQMGTKGNKTALRILSSVDSKDYQNVGFMYQLGLSSIYDKEMDKVYSGIRLSKDSEEILYPNEEFASESKYFVAVDVINIAQKHFSTIIYARPYWITMDGTKVMGLARNNRVEDNINDYTSVPINLLTDGKEPAELAVGLVEMTYNTANYDVVVDDDNQLDSGKVLTKMDYTVNEETGVIKILGRAATVHKNVDADGIFANIRFVKSSDAVSDDLDFTITSSSFCNWNEEMIDTNIFIR